MRTTLLTTLVLLLSLTPARAQQAPSYARQVRPFLAKYCLECHNAKDAKGGLSLETHKALREGGDGGEVVEPGQPDKSRLVLLVEGKDQPLMPPKKVQRRPTKSEIALLRTWVAAGAKDDSSTVKVAVPDIKPHKETRAPVSALAFTPHGNRLLVARGNTLDPGERTAPTVYLGSIGAVAVSRQGDTLALGLCWPGVRGTLELAQIPNRFDPALPETAHRRIPSTTEHKDAIVDLAVSPDGKTIATASYDTQIKLTDVATGKERLTLKEHSDGVYGVAFSPDGKQLASCSADRAVKVWEVATGKLLYTLGEATDWLYAVAWSPDGRRLAAGGVDKSIRVYEPGPAGARITHSVFAHEAPVLKLAFAPDSQTLYSAGQDGVVKAWDTSRMIERKVYDRQPETVLALAVAPDGKRLALGRYDGAVVLLDAATGKALAAAAADDKKSDVILETNAGNSPATGQKITLPVKIAGSLDRAGDVDFYRFEVKKGQPLGAHLVAAPGSKLEPVLQLCDLAGRVLAEGSAGHLGYTFPEAGTYALGVRDRDFRGGTEMKYQLQLGEIPVVTAVFPLGLRRGSAMEIQVNGVFLDQDRLRVQAPESTAPGAMVPLPISSKRGMPLGVPQLVAGEFPEVVAAPGPLAGKLPVPGTGNGRLLTSGQMDVWSFAARKGERLVIEVNAARIGSDLDSILEVLDRDNRPVPRAELRCQALTHVTFRDHDSVAPGIRIDVWDDLGINDYLYVGTELVRIQALPPNPDADCSFFSSGGRRLGYLDTTPTHHSNGSPMYKVTLHPPGTTFAPNGFPVFTLFYRNDDGGPGYGRDSRIVFDPPADGEYHIRIRDAGSQGGSRHGYRLTVRPPRPDFNIRFTPTAPTVGKGASLPLAMSADRLDGYEGPIQLRFDGLPPGLTSPPTTIEAETFTTAVPLYAEADARLPEKAPPLRLIAEAMIDGRKVVKEARGEAPKLADPGDLVTTAEKTEVTLRPGHETQLTVSIERRNGFTGRVPLEVRGLPHGVRVLDIGLNGILITERESRRTITMYAEPWVRATERPIVVLARREGKNSEHGARPVLLKIQEK